MNQPSDHTPRHAAPETAQHSDEPAGAHAHAQGHGQGPADAHGHGHGGHDVSRDIQFYWIIGGALLVATVITVGLAYVDFGSHRANIIVAMIVATIKAGLVAAIFMHLLSEKWTIYRVLLITVVFAIGLFALSLLAFYDPIRVN